MLETSRVAQKFKRYLYNVGKLFIYLNYFKLFFNNWPPVVSIDSYKIILGAESI